MGGWGSGGGGQGVRMLSLECARQAAFQRRPGPLDVLQVWIEGDSGST